MTSPNSLDFGLAHFSKSVHWTRRRSGFIFEMTFEISIVSVEKLVTVMKDQT